MRQLNVRIAVVSFGSYDGLKRWEKEVGINQMAGSEGRDDKKRTEYLLLTDESREVYNYFGLRVSFRKVWGSETMQYYAGQKQQGKEFLRPFENVEDDPLQMGGDFLVNNQGKLILYHPQKTAADRPAINEIILAVEKYKDEKSTNKSDPTEANKQKTESSK